MKVLRKFRDSRYTLIEAEWKGKRFIYLKDREQRTESLGATQKELPLNQMWEKHLQNGEYCLPCELLLHLEQKVLKGENAVAELGITLERLEKFRELLKEVEGEDS